MVTISGAAGIKIFVRCFSYGINKKGLPLGNPLKARRVCVTANQTAHIIPTFQLFVYSRFFKMSMKLSDQEVAEATILLSSERLFEFQRITGSERDAILIHNLCLQVAAAMVPVIGLFEIGLRNAVCRELQVIFGEGEGDWLLVPPLPFKWKGPENEKLKQGIAHAQRAIYAKLSQSQKKALDVDAFPSGSPSDISHEIRSKKRQSVISPGRGQIVAQLSLVFWKRLFSSDYEATLWKRGLRRVFPKKHISRPTVAEHLEIIYQARNRIAHHEPIYGSRLQDFMTSMKFVVAELGDSSDLKETVFAKLSVLERTYLAEKAEFLANYLESFRFSRLD
jgi:hypothetical protein